MYVSLSTVHVTHVALYLPRAAAAASGQAGYDSDVEEAMQKGGDQGKQQKQPKQQKQAALKLSTGESRPSCAQKERLAQKAFVCSEAAAPTLACVQQEVEISG